MNASSITVDHGLIREWAEERGGVPSKVRGTGGSEDPGLLRINFGGEGRKDLEEISWEEFFAKFDEKKLLFLYQDKAKGGGKSRFFKFLKRK